MRRRGRPPHPDILTPREWEVLQLLREGLTNEGIAERLGVTIHAARYHVSEILSKLSVGSREAAAAWQPEREPTAGWRRLLAPLTLAQAGALVTAGGLIVGLGVLAYTVVLSSGDETNAEDNPESIPTPDLSTPDAEEISDVFADLPSGIAEAPVPSTNDLTLGLYTMDTDGNLARIAAPPEDTSGPEWTSYGAALSPDKRWLVFNTLQSGDPLPATTVYLKDLQSGEPAAAVARFGYVRRLAVSPGARYIWVLGRTAPYGDSDNTMNAYLIDLQEDTLTELDPDSQADSAAWSPDGQSVAYMQLGDESGLYIADTDFSNPDRKADGFPAQANWSPDSQTVVVGGVEGFKLVDRNGVSRDVPVFNANSWVGFGVWSPDGSKIALGRANDKNVYTLVVYDVAAGTIHSYPDAVPGDWSPDSNHIAFESAGTLQIIDLATGDITPAIDPRQPMVSDPWWLPDGSILFGYAEGLSSIALIRPDGTDLTHLAYGQLPAWSPDGEQLAFIQSAPLRATEKDNETHVTVINRDGSGIQTVATYERPDELCEFTRPTWSRGGAFMSYVNPHTGLVQILPDGSAQPSNGDDCRADAPTAAPATVTLVYSPDHTQIAYGTGADPNSQVFVGPADAPENAKPITFGADPQWSPDGQWLAFTR